MPGEWSLRDVERKLIRLGATLAWSGNNYRKATRTVGGKRYTYAIPTVKGRKVKPVYIGRIKKILHISDEEWDNA